MSCKYRKRYALSVTISEILIVVIVVPFYYLKISKTKKGDYTKFW